MGSLRRSHKLPSLNPRIAHIVEALLTCLSLIFAERNSKMKSVESPSTLPRLVLVGGPDVDARLDVIQLLTHAFDVIVLGSNRDLAKSFEQLGISYHCYSLSRGVAPIADIRTIFQLTHLLLEIRPDIVPRLRY